MQKIEIANISASYSAPEQALDHAIRLLEGLLSKPRFSVGTGESRIYLEMRRDLPYMAHASGIAGKQILVNRNYKPLGNNARTGEDWVNYSTQRNMHVSLSAEQLSHIVSPGRDRGMFHDGNPPWNGRKDAAEYLQRLRTLRDSVSAS